MPDTAMPERPRFLDVGETFWDFLCQPVLVVCPRCAQQARIGSFSEAPPRTRPLTCGSCGLVVKTTGPTVVKDGRWQSADLDTSLWLQAPCVGETLWAVNLTHLDFVARYASAELRERRGPIHNVSLATRLPKWLGARNHREAVSRAVERLRALANEGL